MISTKLELLTHLLSTLSVPSPQETAANPLPALSPNQRSALLTLHVLFPTETLPALDLLDRGLVHCIQIPDKRPNDEGQSARKEKRVYIVRSSQSPHPRHQHRQHDYERLSVLDDPVALGGVHYEVRPRAWSCSCAAFVFAAFPNTASTATSTATSTSVNTTAATDQDTAREDRMRMGMTGRKEWRAGGLAVTDHVPVCKHLLAVVLVEVCGGVFGHLGQEREGSLEEVVGWAAGWGG